MTHVQGFGADDSKIEEDKEELTVYLCHGVDEPPLLTTTTTRKMSRLNDAEGGWVVVGCCDPCVPYVLAFGFAYTTALDTLPTPKYRSLGLKCLVENNRLRYVLQLTLGCPINFLLACAA